MRDKLEAQMVDRIAPFLDGYAAICRHIAEGNTDLAFDVSRQFAKSAVPLKVDAQYLGAKQKFRRGKR